MENNKLIAEFMGVKFDKGTFYNMGYDIFSNGNLYRSHELKYHTSWDWLMPVLDKIKDIRCLPDEHDESFSWVCKSSDIEAEYNAVVEFINEYNKYICGSCGDHVNEVVFNEDTDVDECTNCTEYYDR